MPIMLRMPGHNGVSKGGHVLYIKAHKGRGGASIADSVPALLQASGLPLPSSMRSGRVHNEGHQFSDVMLLGGTSPATEKLLPGGMREKLQCPEPRKDSKCRS